MEKGKRHIFTKSILLDSVLGTCFIISIILLFQLSRFFGDFALLDPIDDAIRDVEMTDLVFSQIRESPKVDTTVVLVNIGTLSRREIARQLSIIAQYEPAVIGIDSYFYGLKADSLGDLLLSKAFSDIENLVLVSKLEYNVFTGRYDSVRYSHPSFASGHVGFANLETDALDQHQFKVCRSFPPKINVNGDEALAFSVKVSELYDSEKARNFLKRDNDFEVINYRGNIADFGQTNFGGRYVALDVADVFEQKFTPELLKGKIVLMGYMGDNFDDMSWEDKFYTPLNTKYAGRSNPDMFGVVVHANIVSMILNGDFIGKQSKNAGLITALIVCFGTVLLFTIIYQRLPKWYDGLTKTIQLVLVFLIFTVNVFIFHWFNYKTSLTTATIVVALAGDSLEVCYGLIKNAFKK
ncbi:MAG: CHASE2 domain-containing protein [Cyclobacteriaceae bacterium]|nr:CHASE2 domain-containing protein [Cyclobacteriaceae bacterium]